MSAVRSLLLVVLLIVSVGSNAQTTISRQLIKDFPTCNKSFFYPSILRALNTERNEVLDKLVKSIEEAAYIQVLKETNVIATNRFSEMLNQLKKDGFTEMMSMQGPDGNFGLFAHGTEHPDEFVFLTENAESLIIIDIQGELDMATLMKVDMTELQNTFQKSLLNE